MESKILLVCSYLLFLLYCNHTLISLFPIFVLSGNVREFGEELLIHLYRRRNVKKDKSMGQSHIRIEVCPSLSPLTFTLSHPSLASHLSRISPLAHLTSRASHLSPLASRLSPHPLPLLYHSKYAYHCNKSPDFSPVRSTMALLNIYS
jgi:hypothetical protein